MATVFDVAAYILRSQGPMSAMKLQKLVYYSQAWSLVWDDEPLFPEPIEAWSNGPVVRELYDWHRGQFKVAFDNIEGLGNPDDLNRNERETIDVVLAHYGNLNSQTLSDLTHEEDPWRDAREGLSERARSNREITLVAMAEYYSSLRP